MKFLLDAHVLLWAAGMPEKLSPSIALLLRSPENAFFFSVASLWEIAIKRASGHDDFQADARLLRRGLLDNGYSELPITSEHTVSIDSLPPIRTRLTVCFCSTGYGRGHYPVNH